MKKIILIATLHILIFLTTLTAQAKILSGEVVFDFPTTTPNEENWSKIDWQGVDLESKKMKTNPETSDTSWQVKVKSGYVGTNQASVCLLKDSAMSLVERAPLPSECKYVSDELYDVEGPAPKDTYNRNLMQWLTYIFSGTGGCSHIFALSPDRPVFVLRTADNHYAKIKFIDSVKDQRRVVSVMGLGFGKCEKTTELEYLPGRVYVKLEYKYNTVAGDRDLEE